MAFYRYVIYDPVAKRYLWNISRNSEKQLQDIIEEKENMYEMFSDSFSSTRHREKWQKELNRVKKYEIVKMKIERVE
jgi:gas vesicle protein